MIRIREAIVVEGRYDKNTLSQLVDAPIFETSGFGVMNNRELLAFLREVARRRGLIILTDSDGAGFVIRNYLKGALPKEQVLHAYIPDITGKERRKRQAGKEGKLGVEGMTPEILLRALRDAGAHIEGETAQAAGEPITKLDLFELGLSGTADSSERRSALKRELSLPEHLSANGLLDALNILFRREEFLERYKRSNP
ncbi:toprim domain-containing protein [Candidatus Avoscillospira sp. LCP25S3_F1]|uniref:toprim domain-containing protein n=1 Tax=Candidatus Avoscillospira sp. LCP25S3_F1 TaxID=3438825 RepID=UPI003F939EA4